METKEGKETERQRQILLSSCTALLAVWTPSTHPTSHASPCHHIMSLALQRSPQPLSNMELLSLFLPETRAYVLCKVFYVNG